MTRPLLLPLRTAAGDDDETAAELGGAPGLGPELAPEPPKAQLALLPGGQMGHRDQFFATVAHVLRVARRRSRDLAERDGGMVAGLLSGHAPSVAEQDEYARARNWVPPGHDGGALEGMGVIYHWLIGRPGVAYGQAQAAIAARPFRFCVALGLAFSLALIILLAVRLVEAAVLTCLALVLLIGSWAASGWLLMRLMAANATARDEEKEES